MAESAANMKNILTRGIIRDNPTFRMVLGICSTLAVTNRVSNSIAMSLGTAFVLLSSSLSVSLLRNYIPRKVRMAVYTVIIATFVVVVDIYLKAFYPLISKQIGPYVGLIITNCIIMGRAEAFASVNRPFPSVLDALGVGIGYSFSLLLLSSIREPLGFGTYLGYAVFGDWWEPWVLMVMPPGAFLVLGLYIWILRTVSR
ncbi:MAG: electron transport complex subunit RsxE [Deltaproteobacteria bacterium]|nr:electron transport complex subunit RsxE [Deltaproteobacteria bacterium]